MSQAAQGELDAALRAFDRERFDAKVLERAASEWAIRAQNEHASIASFGRFSLGLLGVGAPADLLELSHRAALDEIVHAKMSFAIANAYGGRTLGPGPLELGGALDTLGGLVELVEATVIEGCVGETLSALEAREAERAAVEPCAKLALEQIAEDEARHAELAWAFVRWALAVAPELRDGVRRTFEGALGRVRAGSADARCFEPDLEKFGFLTRERCSLLRLRAVDETIGPALSAMLSVDARD